MLVSQFQNDRRPCPACRTTVVSEIWFILHRHERPQLWQRAASLRTLTCPNGHRGPVRVPLLLFDPEGPFVLYSPGDESNSDLARAEGDHLMSRLWQSLPEDQKTTQLKVEMAPAELLPFMLEDPRLNLGDIAPGALESEQALRICSDIRSGNASPDQLRAWVDDGRLDPALRAGVRFELASYLGREGIFDPSLIEKAIPEWRQLLRVYPRSTAPRRWALSNLELALCYANRREANPAANLREALRLLDAAMEILKADRYPEDFALACSRRANLLLDMGSGFDLVTASISAYQSALSVYTKESYPNDWALGLSNLATAYLSPDSSSSLDDIRQAITFLDQVVAVRTRKNAPESWAVTQMNLGLALSRLPEWEPGNPRARGIEALRSAYEVFQELGETARQYTAAYNLGLTLARFNDLETAEEACDRLEESLPWLEQTNQARQAGDALGLLSQAYLTLLRNCPVGQGERISRRAYAALKDHTTIEIAMQVLYHVGVWLLQNAENNSGRLDLAGSAFERVLGALQATEYAELRAAALANFATVLLLQNRGSRELNRVRARDNLDEAMRIMRSLPPTAERDEQIGLMVMNRKRLDM